MASGNLSFGKQRRNGLRILKGMATSDGAGVKLMRYIGTNEFDQLDPFLLFDVFESNNPDDYITGFPSHPHRGFETATYMLEGQMRHRDNAGNEGVIRAGGVQWMTAGRGIIHSEMPEQENGLLWGTQLWVNLPQRDKMIAPAYQDFTAAEVKVERRGEKTEVRRIAGEQGVVRDRPTEPIYLDVALPPAETFSEHIPATHNAFVFVIQGSLSSDGIELSARTLAILGEGSAFNAEAGVGGCRFLLIAGLRLDEPVARAGPFVMNTQAELKQAMDDYQSGRF